MRNSWSTQDRPSRPGGTIVVTGAGGFDAEDGTRAGASMGRRRNARTCPWFELQFGTNYLGRFGSPSAPWGSGFILHPGIDGGSDVVPTG